MEKKDIERIATEAYFMNVEMIKFLLIENLALKTILHEKGIIDSDEFKEHQQRAAEILEAKTASQITKQFQQLLERGRHGHRDI